MESSSTVEKAIDLLFHLHSARGPLGVTEIGRALGIPKSSAHRMLQALCSRKLVERNGRGRYQPGVGLLQLGLGVQDREPVVAAARPLLEAEAQRLGETLFLVAARGGELIVLDKAEGTSFLRAAPQVGSAIPVHATAVGKLYLAFDAAAVTNLASEAVDALPAFTPGTLTDRTSLQSTVSEVRERGWASSRDEWIAGLSVIAAPVRAGGRIHGAVALGAASARLDELGGDALGPKLQAIAREIAKRIEG